MIFKVFLIYHHMFFVFISDSQTLVSVWLLFSATIFISVIQPLAGKNSAVHGISYVGNPEWGSLEPFIDEEYTIIFGDKLQLELNAAGGKFCISWVQGFENDAYVRIFRDLLQKNGIRCEVSGPFLQVRPKCCLP